MRALISARWLRAAALPAMVSILLAVGSGEVRDAVGYVAPFLALLGLLLADRYPGERLIRARVERHVRRRPAPSARPMVSFAAIWPRGGRLLAFALAGRAPPAPVQRPGLSRSRTRRFQMLKRTTIGCLAALAALLIPAMAQAHVSVHPNTVPEGAFATLDIRVPGEEENAFAYKVDTLFPSGFTSVDIQNVPGWSAKVVTTKLAEPIQTEDGPVTEEVSHVIWTGDKSVDGRLDDGTFMQFPLSIAMPEHLAGKSLAFKTLEYYSNGKVVHWIGAPSAEFPAPTVNITAKGGVLQDVAGGEAGPTPGELPGAESPTASTSSSSSGGASKGLGIAALILGALGLAAGGAALVRSRRTGAS